MTYPREIATERMLLRQWRADDAEALATIYADPEVERMLTPMTLDETCAQVERFTREWDDLGFGLWAVEDLDTRAFIGRIGLHDQPAWPIPGAEKVEVGWTLDRAFWGRGLATEGGRAAIEAAWAHLGLSRIVSFTRVENIRSRSVMARLGLTYRGDVMWRDIPHVWYAIDRPSG